MQEKAAVLKRMVAQAQAKFPATKIKLEINPGYENMIEILKNYPQISEFGMEASRRAGVKPFIKAVRGGTDGSNLTVRGLPTPDLYTGGHNFHGKLEFNSRGGLEKSTAMLIQLVQVWAEKGNGK
jgi:tripeptide aminopeptidase